ncbi:placenta-specific gene 8 protein-like [Orbicella faveolata]|uniref:placenta-specific gene 8 protein-like n=1 Tax=Orbicella faveolata TaxID=48498 RepID=UPI0009E412EA|nr:placenta-specific gene 8 protein-like [Orbicella faveolata]
MSEKPATEYTAMQEEAEAGGPPPYGMQPGYPMAQPGYPQPVMAQPMVQQQTNTTVVVTQPSQVVLQQGMRDWSSGLCGCFEDFYSCCMGTFCGPFLLCDISSRMGEGCCFATCCPGALVALRIKLRVQENIQGSLCNDFCVVQWCGACSQLL